MQSSSNQHLTLIRYVLRTILVAFAFFLQLGSRASMCQTLRAAFRGNRYGAQVCIVCDHSELAPLSRGNAAMQRLVSDGLCSASMSMAAFWPLPRSCITASVWPAPHGNFMVRCFAILLTMFVAAMSRSMSSNGVGASAGTKKSS